MQTLFLAIVQMCIVQKCVCTFTHCIETSDMRRKNNIKVSLTTKSTNGDCVSINQFVVVRAVAMMLVALSDRN